MTPKNKAIMDRLIAEAESEVVAEMQHKAMAAKRQELNELLKPFTNVIPFRKTPEWEGS